MPAPATSVSGVAGPAGPRRAVGGHGGQASCDRDRLVRGAGVGQGAGPGHLERQEGEADLPHRQEQEAHHHDHDPQGQGHQDPGQGIEEHRRPGQGHLEAAGRDQDPRPGLHPPGGHPSSRHPTGGHPAPVAPPSAHPTPGHGHHAPGPVTGLVSTRTATSITLSWTNPTAPDLAAIVVRRATGRPQPDQPPTGTAVTLASANATTVTNTGLAARTQVRVRRIHPRHHRQPRGPGHRHRTNSAAPDSTPPGPVTGLSVTHVTHTSITLA